MIPCEWLVAGRTRRADLLELFALLVGENLFELLTHFLVERLELFLLVVAQVELFEDVRRRERRRTETMRRRTAGAIGTAATRATDFIARAARAARAASTATALAATFATSFVAIVAASLIATLAEAAFAARTARRRTEISRTTGATSTRATRRTGRARFLFGKLAVAILVERLERLAGLGNLFSRDDVIVIGV
jgi:hypothetical protein